MRRFGGKKRWLSYCPLAAPLTQPESSLLLLVLVVRQVAFLFTSDAPSRVFAKRGHCACQRRCICAKILFIRNVVRRDDESHHTGGPILCWISDQSESPSLLSVGSPRRQCAEIVTMQQYGICASGPASGFRDQARDRDVRRIRSVRICSIASFGGDKFMASRNGREFIVTYSAEGDFLRAGIRIEAPNTVLRNEGDRERPVLSADVQRYRSVGVSTQAVHLLVFLNEQLSVDLILGFITGGG